MEKKFPQMLLELMFLCLSLNDSKINIRLFISLKPGFRKPKRKQLGLKFALDNWNKKQCIMQ